MKRFFNILLCIIFTYTIFSIVPFKNVSGDNTQIEEQYGSSIETYGSSLLNIKYRTVNYKYSTVNTYVNPYTVPTFNPSMPNSCAVEAGGNAIAYYNRLYGELIPGYSHRYVWGGFTYGTQNEAVNSMFGNLYNFMESTSQGTTINGFVKGMKSEEGPSTPNVIKIYGENDIIKTTISFDELCINDKLFLFDKMSVEEIRKIDELRPIDDENLAIGYSLTEVLYGFFKEKEIFAFQFDYLIRLYENYNFQDMKYFEEYTNIFESKGVEFRYSIKTSIAVDIGYINFKKNDIDYFIVLKSFQNFTEINDESIEVFIDNAFLEY